MLHPSKLKKRIFYVLMVVVMSWSLLLTRLLWIQVIATRDFSSHHVDLLVNSVEQRKQGFLLSTGRGNIYDRNYQSLLGKKDIYTVVVFPFSKMRINQNQINLLANILGYNKNQMINQIKTSSIPTLLKEDGKPIEISNQQKNQLKELKLPGIFAIDYTLEDSDKVLAKHAIGYLAQAPKVIEEQYREEVERGILKKNSLIGRSGLQKKFQGILMGSGQSEIAYYVDNKGTPLDGLAVKNQVPTDDYYFPLSLVTTIDQQIQRIAEAELKKQRIHSGSVVVLDSHNANILAMASSPDFALNKIDPTSPDTNNKAVQVIEPGSIFKTVVAIAGLEEGVVSMGEMFTCDGELETYHFSCHTNHGKITFEEGFADSCNVVFAEIAQRLGPEKLEEYANKLGVIGQIGWTGEFFKDHDFQQFDQEQLNRMFHEKTNKEDVGALIRTAIGQQDVRMSPLAAANLIVTVLQNGRVHQPKIVEKVIYKNGNDYFAFPEHVLDDKVGTNITYKRVKEMMKQVVEDGTGKLLKQATWELAGKSGTAQTGQDMDNQWFIGYGPVDYPRYAIAVAIKDVQSNAPLAKRVFMGIMNELAEIK